jgi:outer membrane lipoprotein-sorting protein
MRIKKMIYSSILSIIALIAGLMPLLHAQPTAREVIEHVRDEARKVQDYQADIAVSVNIPGMTIPEMDAKIYYKYPDKVHVESDGFAMIPREAIAVHPGNMDSDNYDVVLQGKAKVNQTPCLKLKILAKSDTLRIQRALLYVDPMRWLILRADADPDHGSATQLRFTYTRVDGKYFMPSKIVITMDAPKLNKWGKNALKKDDKKPKESKIVLSYSNFKVNKGVPNSIFEKEAAK